MESHAMFEAVGLTKQYEDGVMALDEVSFSVKPGEIFAILGANGAGKTTLLKIIGGLLAALDLLVNVRGNLHPPRGGPLEQLGAVEAVLVVDAVGRELPLLDPAIDRLLGDFQQARDVFDP